MDPVTAAMTEPLARGPKPTAAAAVEQLCALGKDSRLGVPTRGGTSSSFSRGTCRGELARTTTVAGDTGATSDLFSALNECAYERPGAKPPPIVRPGVVRFVSLDSDFTAELELDPAGLVVRYPRLAERVAG